MSSNSLSRGRAFAPAPAMLAWRSSLIRYGMKMRGRDSRDIPMPPDMIKSWQDRLRYYVGLSLCMGAGGFVGDSLRHGGGYLAVGLIGAAQQFAIAAATFLGAGALTAGFWALVEVAFSRRTRKRIGRSLERDVAGMTAGELAQEIAVVRDGLARAPNARLRDSHADWLAWLEAQAAARPVEALDRPMEWTFRPTPIVQVMKLCVGGCFFALAVWIDVNSVGEHEIIWFKTASAVGLAGLGVWLIASMWTLCVQLTPERLELRAFWLTRWAVARDRAEIRAAVVGGGAATPGYGVFDTQTGKQVGQLAGTLFRAADLRKLAALFPPPAV